MKRKTKETKKSIEKSLEKLNSEEQELRNKSEILRHWNRGWNKNNMRDVQHRLVENYFAGELAENLHTYVDLSFLGEKLSEKLWACRERNPKSEKLRCKFSDLHNGSYKLADNIRGQEYLVFETIRKSPEEDRLILAKTVSAIFHRYLDGQFGTTVDPIVAVHSDGDPNWKVSEGLRSIGLDHLVVHHQGAYIPRETIEKAYLDHAELPREELDKKGDELKGKFERLDSKRKKLETKLDWIEYAESCDYSVDALRSKMPNLLEDLERVRKSYDISPERVVLDPETNTMALMFDNHFYGAGIGMQKIVVAVQNGKSADKRYTYRNANSQGLDNWSLCFDNLSIKSVNDNEVSLGLIKGDYERTVDFDLKSENNDGR